MANTIPEVIKELEFIVNEAKQFGSRYGYFATLYLQMTRAVVEGIKNGVFEDGPRMEKLDVIFANRYLDAFNTWKAGGMPSKCWKVAFHETQKDSIAVIQHLLCGINAHINLDLGIAAAQTASGKELQALESDFDRINDVIQALMGETQKRLNTLSFFMRFLDKIGGKADSVIANFSIQLARKAAWNLAIRLDGAQENEHSTIINGADNMIAFLAHRIIHPGFGNLLLKPIHWGEPKDVRYVLTILDTKSDL